MRDHHDAEVVMFKFNFLEEIFTLLALIMNKPKILEKIEFVGKESSIVSFSL